MKGRKYVLLSLILALLAAGAVYQYLSDLEKANKAAASMVPVIVPKTDIPARTKLDSSMFTTMEIPQPAVHKDLVKESSQLAGSYALDRLVAGEQVLATRISATRSKAGMAYKVSAGHRAVAVPVNNVSGVAGFILPGDLVDCVVTLAHPVSDESATLTTVVAENIRVLAAGQHSGEQDGEQLVVDTVTLDVPAERVASLIQASERGSLRLVLRPAEDTTGKRVDSRLILHFWDRLN